MLAGVHNRTIYAGVSAGVSSRGLCSGMHFYQNQCRGVCRGAGVFTGVSGAGVFAG